VAWLWTDTLAYLLMEHDGVAPELLRAWIRRPMGVRLADGTDPLALARSLLVGQEPDADAGATASAVARRT